ncbi:hypothetical protein [Tepidibacter hydrothermalis]|uniref:MotA/TolQ/ExbB proton channel domain-containing protein n=1 Tax=Tepidibacter hydrothermalis TaxID=3036126 RepID=A0ABY8EA22_9FIRM|nr:hypothetical protein [Tepidibacter hydrothermalis]WFD09782.1 hypothetical protein P4S50_15495 [Tepidibacter hydrothermalis]
MIYEILHYYKRNLNTYKLVFIHIKFWYFLLLTTAFILAPIAIAICVPIIKNPLYENLFFISIFLILFALFFFINNKTKKVTYSVYDISSEEIIWNSSKVLRVIHNFKKKEMLKYLREENGEIDIVELKKLSNIASIEAENLKVKFPIIPSVFAALFISLCNNFLNWVYSTGNIKNLDEALSIFKDVSLMIFTILGLYLMLSGGFSLILNDIFNKDNQSMMNLSRLLKDICNDLEKEEARINSSQNECKNIIDRFGNILA